MKEKLTLLYPKCEDAKRTKRLDDLLTHVLQGYSYDLVQDAEDFVPLENQRILFAVSLGISGINLEYYRFLKKLRMNNTMLLGSVGGIIIDGEGELYTKSVARELAFTANLAGCTFPGRSLVEGTEFLTNFNIQAANLEVDHLTAYHIAAKTMVENLLAFTHLPQKTTNILVLHASNHKTSNTFLLWTMVKKHLQNCNIQEISLRNGTISDCAGCPYKMCMHFSDKDSCFYGGVITENVYPAIEACDALLLLCPNYNDACSANITAFINRLTALFRKAPFYEKNLFALVVSGYSGGNIVAEQLISALSMNKTFRLPPKFAMIETANNPTSILNIQEIEQRAKSFAQNMMTILTTPNETEDFQ